jgi:glycerol-3-phosphate dehydrogenase
MSMLGDQASRRRLWQQLLAQQGETHWDMVVVGGGIVGAGVLREAARLNLKVLLLERQDFSWGTSSRSSKMVHGGLRYIASGDFRITRESVVERERLLREAAGLVTPLPYLFTSRKRQFPGRWSFTALLNIYDFFAGRRDHRFLAPDQLELQAPHLQAEGLKGACQYTDATTDDSRLVLRIMDEAVGEGGVELLNYVAVESLLEEAGQVAGVRARDVLSDTSVDIRARVVVNATGAWADQLRQQVGGEKHIRPLRGSHLVFPYHRLPVSQAVTVLHPADRRPVFIFPWEGATVVGTTDLDHREDLDREAAITREETDYLLRLVHQQFPGLGVTEADVLSTWSGVRPVVSSGKLDPSAERRDHSVWQDRGLVSVAGGKLTTFRAIALDVLAAAADYLPLAGLDKDLDQPIFAPVAGAEDRLAPLLAADQRRRLLGRYGAAIVPWVLAEQAANLETITGTRTLWTELRWAAAREAVCHLDDLLLRRTRIGLLVKDGAMQHIDRVRELVQPLLAWDDARWAREVERYRGICRDFYSLPA